MNELLKKGDQILVSTDVDPQLKLVTGESLLRMFVVVVHSLRFTCAMPIDSRNVWLIGKRVSLPLADEGTSWARGWDRDSKRAFRAMLKLRVA